MYRKEENDVYEARRSRHRSNDRDEYRSSAGKTRSRWDDRRNERKEDSSRERRNYEDSRRSRWDDKNKYSTSASPSSSSSQSRSKERRSRSRSRSPYMKQERDYNSSRNDAPSSSRQLDSRKPSSWSDSSDEDLGLKQTRSSVDKHIYSHPEYGKHDETRHQRVGTNIPSGSFSQNPRYLDASRNSNHSSSSGHAASTGISVKLGGSSGKPVTPIPKVITATVPVKATKVAAIFNTDSDDEPEEMPPECKMRMKNIGRETKTSEGPNSFGKTKIGFCNLSHLTEKRLEGKPDGSGKKPSGTGLSIDLNTK